MLKQCRVCYCMLPLSKFGNDIGREDGLNRNCKVCAYTIQAEIYKRSLLKEIFAASKILKAKLKAARESGNYYKWVAPKRERDKEKEVNNG